MSFQAYIDSKIPHLREIHLLLGLGPDELQHDLTKINDEIRKAIDRVVEGREAAVASVHARVEALRVKIRGVYEAMGEVDDGVMPDGTPLPEQLTRLEFRLTSALAHHATLLTRLRSQQLALLELCTSLGPEFVLPHNVESSVLGGMPSLENIRYWQAGPGGIDEVEDVGPRRMAVVQEAIGLANEAKAECAVVLLDRLEDLRYLIGELSLLPPSTAFDERSLVTALQPYLPVAPPAPPTVLGAQPQAAETSTGAATLGHQSILIRYLQSYPPPIEDATGYLTASATGTLHLPSTCAHPSSLLIEPTHSLLTYLSSINEAWQTEKLRRRDRIQTLYGELEAIYRRLEGDDGEMMTDLRVFVEGNCGLSLRSVESYEKKLEAAKILRKTNVALYIEAARKDIEMLWELLLYGPASMAAFEAYHTEDLTDDCLDQHEYYMDSLSTEQDKKGLLLTKAREWVRLRQQEVELVEKENGPDRYNTRGGALLQLQKARKRIDTLKPKLESELLNSIPAWEEEYGMPFMVDDCRLTDVINEDRAERAIKKAPRKPVASVTPGRPPAAKTAQTPGARSITRTPSAGLNQSQGRKREAMPSVTPTAKRPRIATGPGSSPLGSKGLSRSSASNARTVLAPVMRRPAAMGISTAGNLSRSTNGSDSATALVDSASLNYIGRPTSGSAKRRMSFKPTAQPARSLSLGADLALTEEEEDDDE